MVGGSCIMIMVYKNTKAVGRMENLMVKGSYTTGTVILLTKAKWISKYMVRESFTTNKEIFCMKENGNIIYHMVRESFTMVMVH